MMRAQEQEGWLTKPAIETIADMLDMPYIRALEVATFYTQFQLKPVGRRAHVQVCGTTPCMLRGAEALMDVCRKKIHPDQFHTNARGMMSWEEVECLGACVNAPMVMIFKDTYEDLTPERLEEIIDQFAIGKGPAVPVGPQNGRTVSAPQSGLTSLKGGNGALKSTRDKEERADARAERAEAANTDAATVPPSKAAKPQTYAPETNGTLRTPSPEKTSRCGREGHQRQFARLRRCGRQQGRARCRGGGEAAQVAVGQIGAGRVSRRRNCCAASRSALRERGSQRRQAVARRSEPACRHRKACRRRRPQADLGRRAEDRGHSAFARHLQFRAGRRSGTRLSAPGSTAT